MSSSAPQLSKTRTFLLWALAVVWFSEMLLWGVRPLSEMWTRVWQIVPPEDPQLATALYITHAFEAGAKGALGVLAVFALRSKSPSARSALFVPMALIPPLNLAFQFRAQGFPLRATTVATVLSIILWGSFFLFRERTEQPRNTTAGSRQSPPSRWESLQYIWFAANAVVLTLISSLFLFAPDSGAKFTLPCLSGLIDTSRGVPSGLTLTSLAVGTHLLSVATATWIATVYFRSNPTVRQAVAAANTLHAGLLCILPLRQIALDVGRDCATSSLLIYAIPLFAGWVIYAALSYRATLTGRLHLAQPAGD